MAGGVLLALGGGACFGLANVIGRMAISRCSVYHVALWSVLVPSGVLGALVLVLAVTSHLGADDLRALPYFVGAGVAADFTARFSLYAASARLGASRASGFRVLAPIVTISFGLVVFDDRLRGIVPAGLAVMLLGTGLIQGDAIRHAESIAVATREAAGPRVGSAFAGWAPVRQGIAFGVVAAFAFGCGDLLRKGGVETGASPFFGAFAAGTTALILYLARGVATNRARSYLVVDRETLRFLAATGTCVVCALSLFFSSLSLIPAGVASSVSGTQVLFAILFGWLLNQRVERISRLVVLGGLLVVGGLMMLLDS